MRKWSSRYTAARLLVLGDKRVGKSAAIVRYTTGRFIQNYCPATSDWLYKHPVGCEGGARNQCKLVELLEQKDIQLDSEQLEELEAQQRLEQPAARSLATRVALDRRSDNEFYEKQQLLNKLRWANAFVVVYALNDAQSFNKAIKYLNLIANELGSSPASSPAVPVGDAQPTLTSRRPILLLGNKCDLEGAGAGQVARQVSQSDARLLAMRHQCQFVEVSVAQSREAVGRALAGLVDSIQPADLHTIKTDRSQGQLPAQTQLTYWIPTASGPAQRQAAAAQGHPPIQQPIWASLVRSYAAQSVCSSSQQLVQASCLAAKPAAKQAAESRFRLLTPVGVGGPSSGPSPASSSSSSGSASGSLLPAGPAQPAKLTQPAHLASASLLQAQARPSISSTSSMSSTGLSSSSSSRSQANNRYASLKSSFRKASLAIVGSRSLARKASASIGALNKCEGAASQHQQQQQAASGAANSERIKEETSSSDSEASSSAGTIGASGNSATMPSSLMDDMKRPRANWIRSKLGALGRHDTTASNSDTSSLAGRPLGGEQQRPTTTGRFKRPLFKYRNRRVTLSFEPAALDGHKAPPATDNQSLCQVSVTLDGGEPHDERLITASSNDLTPTGAAGANSIAEFRNSSYNALFHTSPPTGAPTAHSSQSSSVFIIELGGPRPSSSARSTGVCSSNSNSLTGARPHLGQLADELATNRKDSRSTLSRGSTSTGGSYDEDSELESCGQQAAGAHCQRAKMASGSSRHQLVKSVQSTLINLARSTGPAPRGSAAALPGGARRSFCNALFSGKSGLTKGEPGCLVRGTMAGGQLAQVERVHTIPVVGFCK